MCLALSTAAALKSPSPNLLCANSICKYFKYFSCAQNKNKEKHLNAYKGMIYVYVCIHKYVSVSLTIQSRHWLLRKWLEIHCLIIFLRIAKIVIKKMAFAHQWVAGIVIGCVYN